MQRYKSFRFDILDEYLDFKIFLTRSWLDLSWLATLVISLAGDDLFLPQLSHVINDAATLDYDLFGRDKKQPPGRGHACLSHVMESLLCCENSL